MRLTAFLLLLFTYTPRAYTQIPEPNGGPVEPGEVFSHWMTGGPNCSELQDWEVHQYNPDFSIIRESGCTNYEKPFLYLLFGKERALLVDTGAGPAKTYDIVTQVMSRWAEENHKPAPPLTVTHSHGHGDHIAGDAQFRGKPGIVFVGANVREVSDAFGIKKWPETTGSIDLGDRVIDVVPLPGHQEASVVFYDRKTGVLLTGDSLYPGRLYVTDWEAFKLSTQRLVEFTDGKVVTHILGCHIEQAQQPYLDYPVGTAYQPKEHSLALGRGELLELNEGLRKLGSTPARVAYRDFTIWPREPRKRPNQ